MEYFRQLWNAVWHFEHPESETIQWLVDTGIGDCICFGIVIVPTVIMFMLWCEFQYWIHWTKPRREFEAKMERFHATGGTDFSIFDE